MSDLNATPVAAGAPHFPSTSGTGHSVNLRDYDGTILFGEGSTLFETHWDGEFRAYRQGDITGVAVMELPSDLASVDATDLLALNYTNRERMSFIGGVIVLRRVDGSYLLVAQTGRHKEGNEVAIMTFDYRMILSPAASSAKPDERSNGLIDARGETFYAGSSFLSGGALLGGAPLNSGPLNGEVSSGTAIGQGDRVAPPGVFDLYQPFAPEALPDAARAMRDRLEGLLHAADQFEAERLSNNPPPEIILDAEVRREALSALDALSRIDATDPGSHEAMRKLARIILKTAGQVLKWTGGKLDKVIDATLEAGAQEGMRLFVTSSIITHAWNTAGTDLVKLGMSALKAIGG